MAVPTDRVTDFAAYNDPFYAVAPITAPVNPIGQFSTGGSAYCQINVKYPNNGPTLDAGTVIFPVTEDTAVKSNI